MHRSFREIIKILDDKGSLVRIKKEVDPKYEMAAIMKKLEQEGKAFLFENVQGSIYQAVGGLFTSMDRYGLIFNEDAAEEYTYDQAGQKVLLGVSDPIPCVEKDKGPVTEEILRDQDIDLLSLPVPTFFELDTGPFITAAVGIFRKPDGNINVGFYRCLIENKNHILINAIMCRHQTQQMFFKIYQMPSNIFFHFK